MELTQAWSFTALTAFETCPLRFYLTKVAKVVVEPSGPALEHGREVHRAFEDRAAKGIPFPPQMEKYEPYVAKIQSLGGDIIVERKISLDRNLKETQWFAKDVWVRGAIDIGSLRGSTAVFLDWKTGKRKPDSDQLKLFALLGFSVFPEVERIKTGFVWLDEDKFDHNAFTRDQIPALWGEFLPRLSRLAHAYAEDSWLPKPSGLCRKWCPVGKKHCSHCGE